MITCHNPYFIGMNLAIEFEDVLKVTYTSHNPYFIGMNLAIRVVQNNSKGKVVSQSLFYWNEPCNGIIIVEELRK